MVTRSNAWWMTKTKGIYIFSISPSRVKAAGGFLKEVANLAKLHWKGSILYGGATIGAYYLGVWSNNKYLESLRKDPREFENESLTSST